MLPELSRLEAAATGCAPGVAAQVREAFGIGR